MAGKRGRKRAETQEVVKEETEKKVFVDESIDVKPSVGLVPSVSESELVRNQLRERWELASVLNFLRVFKPLIQNKLETSAEEIETALITPNNDLTELHIALLKGIPPISKNLTGPDAWVTVLHKKLASWWRWVAEGEIPLKAAHGEESFRYKELDPINRLLILKALCEIRAFQDDAVSYINGALKQGTEVCSFRKDRIGGDGTGIGFWNDGDAVTGYRLYKEVTQVEFTPRKGKGRLTQPPNSYRWETLATNLEEFRQISDQLSSSEIVEEASVAEVLKNEIVPVLEEFEKKKERALKRQQKQVMLLNGYLNSYRLEGTRSCRNRKPVNYTFDDYDRSIDEAIQENKKIKTFQEPKHGKKGIEHDVNSNGNGFTEHNTDDDDDKFRGVVGDSDSGDEDYDDKNDENDNDDNENEEEDNDNEEHGDQARCTIGPGTRARGNSQKKNGHLSRDVAGLRRSNRIPGNTVETRNHVETRKQRSHSTENDSATVSDSDDGSSAKGSADKASDDASSSKGSTDKTSDDESSSKSSADKTSSAGKESLDVLQGLIEESEESEEGVESEEGEESEENESVE